MLGMLWIALELRNSKLGLITTLSSLCEKEITFKNDGVAESGNIGGRS